MSASRKADRFKVFVAISVAIHLALVVAALVVSLLQPKQRPKPVAFELVGIPAQGQGGSPERAPQTDRPTDATETRPPPKSQPDPKPQKHPQAAPTPPEPPSAHGIAKRPVPQQAVAKPNPPDARPDGTKGSQQSTAAPSSTEAKPGKAGVPAGDTLAVGNAKGLPSPMAFWLSRVKFLVEQNWKAPDGLSGVQQMPEVVFQVARDGRPSLAQLKVKSGNPSLDRIALRAIQSVPSFPPVPDVWPEDKVVVRYVLQYNAR